MTQIERIRKWLDRGYGLTQAQAYERFGCLRLSERIRELERRGMCIEREEVKIKRQDGTRARVVRYKRDPFGIHWRAIAGVRWP
jgi:hypothetical protein